MATGFTNTAEAAILDNATVGLGRTLYLALFKWSGTAGAGAGVTPTEAGGMPTNLAEVVASGYSRKTVASTDWNSAVGGDPTVKQTNATWTWSATAAFGELASWGLYDASTGGNLVVFGPLTNSSGTATSVTVNAGETFQFDATNPIKIQLGDPTDTFG